MESIHKCFYPKEYHVARNMIYKKQNAWGHSKEFQGLLQVVEPRWKHCSKRRWRLLKLSIVFVGTCVKNANLCFLRQRFDN